MQKILFVLAMVLLPMVAFASPFIACEPYPPAELQPQYFYVSLDGATPVKVTHVFDPQGWKLLDIGNVSVGQHEVKVKACTPETDVWLEACSAEVPFAFTRPASILNNPYLKLLK